MSVRVHLLEMAGNHDAARAGYQAAARRTASEPERRHLLTRAARLVAEGFARQERENRLGGRSDPDIGRSGENL